MASFQFSSCRNECDQEWEPILHYPHRAEQTASNLPTKDLGHDFHSVHFLWHPMQMFSEITKTWFFVCCCFFRHLKSFYILKVVYKERFWLNLFIFLAAFMESLSLFTLKCCITEASAQMCQHINSRAGKYFTGLICHEIPVPLRGLN